MNRKIVFSEVRLPKSRLEPLKWLSISMLAISLATFTTPVRGEATVSIAQIVPNLMPSLVNGGQTAPMVPLSVAFDESLVNSPRAANIRAQLGISKAAYAQAYTFPNPSAYYFNDTAQQARQIGASIPIEPPWKFVFRLLLAKNQIKQADLEIQKSLWLFRNSIRRAYLDAVIARESGETLQDLLTLSSNLFSIASRRCDAGDAAGNCDVSQAGANPERRAPDAGDRQASDRVRDAHITARTGVSGDGDCVVAVGHVGVWDLGHGGL